MEYGRRSKMRAEKQSYTYTIVNHYFDYSADIAPRIDGYGPVTLNHTSNRWFR
jgi:hypothetical protein